MNPPLPERLARALLAEMVSGNYRPGMRFLSHRKIMKQWKISTPTANKALDRLVEWEVVEVRDRSGHYLTKNFRELAFLKLNHSGHSKDGALPARTGWEARVASNVRGKEPLKQIAVIILLPEENAEGLAGKTDAHMPNIACALTLRGIFNEAAKQGVVVDFYVDNNDPKVKRSITDAIAQTRPQGAIIVRRIFSDKTYSLTEYLLSRWIPVVTAFGDCENTRMVSVNFNNIGIGYTAASSFIEHGHRRIGVLLRQDKDQYFADRLRGCQIAAQKHEDCEIIPILTDGNIENLEIAARQLIQSKATAVLATGEELLAGIKLYLDQANITVPDDLSAIICSSTSEVKGFDKPLDCIKLRFEDIGEYSFNALADFYQGEIPHKSILIDSEMEKNDSVTRPTKQSLSDGDGMSVSPIHKIA